MTRGSGVHSYAYRHLLIKLDRGKASEHPCVDCGKPAQEWSQKVTNPGSGTYDPEDFEPRCIPCHFTYDDRGGKVSQTHQQNHRLRGNQNGRKKPGEPHRNYRWSVDHDYEEGRVIKSNVYHQFDISDQERSKIADLLDDEKTKRIATRDELKEFVDGYAARWREGLAAEHAERFGEDAAAPAPLAAVPDLEPEVDGADLI